jgi:hypothetical protein
MRRNARIALGLPTPFCDGQGERLIWIKGCALRRGMKLPTKKMTETLVEIEEAQAGLRDSIERARDLAEETDRLVHKHRREAAKPPNPAS